MMRHTLALAAALAACGTVYSETADRVTIHQGYGGHIEQTRETYRQIAAKGKPVVIDGQVHSADAFFAFSLPGACYTDNAVWSPHAASYLGIIPARGLTRSLTRQLPPPLAEWLRGNTAYHDWIGWAEVDAERLREIWPEGACEGRP